RYIYAICDTYACCASFFFDARASTELYTLALHDALPIVGLVTVRKPTRRERQHFLQTFHHQRERLLIAVRWIHPMPSSKMKVIDVDPIHPSSPWPVRIGHREDFHELPATVRREERGDLP